ncbi:P2 family phage major capsid protein [Avibacterium paragallinarum]|uniref:P2 family phage major capsid protein n=1 Tax=Avibacterium paragallinarum TaxID=728 RepID=UPI0039793715
MENFTAKQYNNYIQHLSTMLKVNIDGALSVFDLDGKVEKEFFKSLETSPFLGLINIIKTTEPKGEALGITLPIPSQTNINQQDRTPEKGHISPPQKFHCEQIDLDTYISYPKLDRIAGVLEVDFNKNFDNHLTTEILLSLLLVGWNGKQRLETSNPAINKLAEDVKKGWLQKIRENAPTKLISLANVGENQQYKSLNALIKAGLEKIDNPIKLSGDLIAICGRNVLSDFPIDAALSTPRMTVSQKLIGGLKAVGVDYFPADSILITRLDNLSLYVQKGTIRRIMERNPAKDRLDIYNSLVADFIIEDYNAVALIENINIID